jgi:nickel/cobalt transporter (NicO) family protein
MVQSLGSTHPFARNSSRRTSALARQLFHTIVPTSAKTTSETRTREQVKAKLAVFGLGNAPRSWEAGASRTPATSVLKCPCTSNGIAVGYARPRSYLCGLLTLIHGPRHRSKRSQSIPPKIAKTFHVWHIRASLELVDPDMKSAAAIRFPLALWMTCLALSAHPMGNFSVNHYSHLHFRERGMDLTYVLDLAEIPTFELLGQWQIDWKDEALLSGKCKLQAQDWLSNLAVLQGERRLPLRLISVSSKAVEGAGALPILRITITAQTPLQPGEVIYSDGNYPGRAGWKEIGVDHSDAGTIESSSQSSKDISNGLTNYPTDPTITPPQDLTARVVWTPVPAVQVSSNSPLAVPRALLAPQTAALASTAPPANSTPSFSQTQPTAPGTVVRGDFLSRLLGRRDLGLGLILVGFLAAFGLGAMHAMSPGHGKTIVAAYLVGSRGTLKHAGLLGFVVTFTHTFTVFLLGLGVLFFQQYIVPEKIVPLLGVISGLSIVGVGALLLYRRVKALLRKDSVSQHAHHHHHDHDHPHTHAHDHQHDHGPSHAHDHHHEHGTTLVHSHGGYTHSHTVPDRVSLGSLIALGVSGGLVPCPSALILILSAIALGRPGLGLILLIGFSAGLAIVLIAIGAIAVYAKHLLPASQGVARKPFYRLIPVLSSVVVICLGLVMTAVSAGWIQPSRFLS